MCVISQAMGATIGSFSKDAQGDPFKGTIDLTDFGNQTLKADLTTKGDAAYTNNIGFYAVKDVLIGAIEVNGVTLNPGDLGYAKAAVDSAIANLINESIH